MSEQIALLGLSPASVVAALELVRLGRNIAIYDDGGDDLASLGGVLRWGPPGSAASSVDRDTQRRVDELLDTSGLGWRRGPFVVASALGQVLDADALLPGLLPLRAGVDVCVVGFGGWREWSPTAIVDGLRRRGFGAEAVELPVRDGHGHLAMGDVSAHALGARLADARFRREIALAVRARFADVAAPLTVLLPPVLGPGREGVSPLDGLASDLGVDAASVGQAVPLAPSPIGERYLDDVRAVLAPQLMGPRLEPSELTLVDHRLKIRGVARPSLVASRRVAAWIEERFGVPRPQAPCYLGVSAPENAWPCGRARLESGRHTLSQELASGLEAARRAGAMARAA